MSTIGRRSVFIFVLCFCWATPAMSQMQMQMQMQLRLSYLGNWVKNSLPGYFHLSDNVVRALHRGDASQKLAYRILSELYDNDIVAGEVLTFNTTLAEQAHSSTNAAKTMSVIKNIFATYREGIRQKLRPPLPESVVYTFAHFEAEFNKMRMAPAFKELFKVEVVKTGNKLAVRFPNLVMSDLQEHDAELWHNVKSLTSYVVAKQLRFFASSARGDYLQPLDIFDKNGKQKSLQKVHIREASEDLNISPEKIYRLIHIPMTKIYTEYGVFPLHFFFRDAAMPEEGLMMKIKEKISSENLLSPFTDGDLAESLAKTEDISITAREVSDYRNKLGIASFAKRRKKVVIPIVRDMIAKEDAFTPLLDGDIADHLRTMGLFWSAKEVLLLRQKLAIPASRQRKNNAVRAAITLLVKLEDTSPLSNREIAQILAEMGYIVDERMIRRHLSAIAVPSYRERRSNSIENLIRQIVEAEEMTQPLSAREIVERLWEHNIFFSESYIHIYLRNLGIPTSSQRKKEH